jgi:hypothetical protein
MQLKGMAVYPKVSALLKALRTKDSRIFGYKATRDIIFRYMTTPKGIDWKHVSFVVGHREDVTKEEWKKNAFIRMCSKCNAKAYLETDYPHDVPVVCNVCAADITTQLEGESATQLLYTLPNDLKARLIDMAQEQRIPIEDVCRDFLSWKLGRPTQASLYNGPDMKKPEE